MKTAWAYIRISSQDQKEGISPDTQKSEILEQSKKDGDCKITKFYQDDAKSAYSDKEDISTGAMKDGFRIEIAWNNRHDFEKMLKDIEVEKPDVIYFYMLSRLARNLMLQTGIFHYIERHGIELRFVKDYKKTESEIANFLIKISLGMSNELSSLITQIGTNSAFKRKFEQGLFPKPFFGYEGIKQGGHIVEYRINEAESKIIKEVFKSKINKENYKDTCKRLGIETKTYFRILKRQEYTGIIVRNGEQKEVPNLKIIDLETWNKAQK